MGALDQLGGRAAGVANECLLRSAEDDHGARACDEDSYGTAQRTATLRRGAAPDRNALAYARGATMPAHSAATRAATCDEEQSVFQRPGGGCCFGRDGIESRSLAVFSRVV